MSSNHAYAIEVQGKAAGVVVARHNGARHSGFQFFAADHRFHALDGRVFRRVDQAERAARALSRGGPAPDRMSGGNSGTVP